jgi:hypothetical protein
MKLLKVFFSILTLLLMVGCAEVTPVGVLGDYFQPENKLPPKGMSNLYVYNPYSQPENDQPVVYIDGKKAVKLPNASYTLMIASSGPHVIGIQNESIFGSGKSTAIKSIYLDANKNYYLEYQRQMDTSVAVHPIGNTYSTTITPCVTNQKFILMDSYSKASSIAACRFIQSLIEKI